MPMGWDGHAGVSGLSRRTHRLPTRLQGFRSGRCPRVSPASRHRSRSSCRPQGFPRSWPAAREAPWLLGPARAPLPLSSVRLSKVVGGQVGMRRLSSELTLLISTGLVAIATGKGDLQQVKEMTWKLAV